MRVDDVTKKTLQTFVWSKINSGRNSLPDWVENSAIGYTSLGTPYFDSIKLKLDDFNVSDEYVNTLISVSNSAEISRTFVNGRKGSICQITNEGDYDITMNIKIFSEFGTDNPNFQNNVEIHKTGRPFIQGLGIGRTGVNINPFNLGIFQQHDYSTAYTPNYELSKLISLINKFYTDYSYNTIQVESLYLNDVFGIFNIIPYSIQTQQDVDNINTYTVIIQAYSSFPDDPDTLSEIIPK